VGKKHFSFKKDGRKHTHPLQVGPYNRRPVLPIHNAIFYIRRPSTNIHKFVFPKLHFHNTHNTPLTHWSAPQCPRTPSLAHTHGAIGFLKKSQKSKKNAQSAEEQCVKKFRNFAKREKVADWNNGIWKKKNHRENYSKNGICIFPFLGPF